MNTISSRDLHERLQKGEALSLLDVRTPVEFEEIHVPQARLVPLDRLDPEQIAGATAAGRQQSLFLLCRSGGRARLAAEKLEKAGFTQCHVVEGGTMAWAEAGLPVHRGARKVISLERQVRIAAGSIVLTGVVLAQWVHPAFIWLSGFVGAGLVFAGLTDWCGMGLLLARMPWNQRSGAA